MTVRSKQLGASTAVPVGGANLYNVPAGYRTIVKSLVLQNTGAAQRVAVRVYAVGGAQLVNWHYTLAAGGSDGESVFSELWAVLNAGQGLWVIPPTAAVQALISGAELQL